MHKIIIVFNKFVINPYRKLELYIITFYPKLLFFYYLAPTSFGDVLIQLTNLVLTPVIFTHFVIYIAAVKNKEVKEIEAMNRNAIHLRML